MNNKDNMKLITLDEYKNSVEVRNTPRMDLEELKDVVMRQVNSSVPEIVCEMSKGIEIQTKILNRINELLDTNRVVLRVDKSGHEITRELNDSNFKTLSSAARDASETLLKLRGLDVNIGGYADKKERGIDHVLKEIAAQTILNKKAKNVTLKQTTQEFIVSDREADAEGDGII